MRKKICRSIWNLFILQKSLFWSFVVRSKLRSIAIRSNYAHGQTVEVKQLKTEWTKKVPTSNVGCDCDQKSNKVTKNLFVLSDCGSSVQKLSQKCGSVCWTAMSSHSLELRVWFTKCKFTPLLPRVWFSQLNLSAVRSKSFFLFSFYSPEFEFNRLIQFGSFYNWLNF